MKTIDRFYSSHCGFTLIELLVTIGILRIAASIAIPGFSRWIPNYRLNNATRDIFSNFQLAKVTAIKAAQPQPFYDPNYHQHLIGFTKT